LLAIIQARSNSKRFKNKVLYKLLDKTLIEYVVDNVKKSKYIKKIFVATSKNKIDKKLSSYLKFKKINVFNGDLNDVALRLIELAIKKKASHFVRINGDSPLIDSKLIDKAINIYKKNKSFDLITNVFPRTFPAGQSVEIIKTNTLKSLHGYMSKDEKEHVTKYFYKNYKKYKIKNFVCSKNYKFKNIKKMTVDYKSDIRLIKKILNEN